MIPKLGRREIVHENPFHRIFRVVAQFEGFQKEYFVNTYGQRVGLLLISEGRILLVRQYRLLVNQLTWEIPGGKVNAKETPIQAAEREVMEETGIVSTNLKPLIFTHPGLDTFENPTTIFYSDSFQQTSFVDDPSEVVEKHWIPFTNMLFQGEIVDSMTMIALMAYQLKLQRPD